MSYPVGLTGFSTVQWLALVAQLKSLTPVIARKICLGKSLLQAFEKVSEFGITDAIRPLT